MVWTLTLIFFLFSCQTKQGDQFCQFHDDGRKKPTVAIVDVIDSTCYDVPWSLSEEFSTKIKQNILKDKKIYIAKENDEITLPGSVDPFGPDIVWAKDMYRPNEFVVFLELIEHKEVPVIKTAKKPDKIPEIRRNAYNLNTAIRIRIVDIRSGKTKIVLQEKIKDSHYIANNIDNFNYQTTTWPSSRYKKSPMGKYHDKLAKQISERISDYIMLAQSR